MELVSTHNNALRVSDSAQQYYSAELIDHLLNDIVEYAIFMIDIRGIIVTWNPGVERLLGYSEKQFIGQPFSLIFNEQEQAEKAPQKELETAKQTGRAEDQRWHRRKDGTQFWANGLITSTRNSQHELTGFVKIMRDQTRQKELEMQIVEYAKRLNSTNRQLLKFAGVVSHDLNAPLQSVLGFASIIKEKTKGSDTEVDMSIRNIMDSADRMLNLVSELLHFSKDSDGPITLETINSEEIFREVLQNLDATIQSSNAVITHDPLPMVEASAVQLNRIFQNLIENSIKFAKPGQTPRIHVHSARSGDYYEFRIQDNGIGIDIKEQEKLFNMFERIAPEIRAPGFGIGLASTKRIVELLGGTLSVQSQKGQGATFIFSLPAKKQQQADQENSLPIPQADI